MTTVHDFTLKTIDGKDKPLATYREKALLLVNVASRCGFTPQYKGLEALYRKLGPRGLAVLGIPCNQFGAQEPGSEPEILDFCTSKYDVTFDMFAKIEVNGPGADPLYKWLTDDGKAPIAWNFEKFVVGKDGNVVARFESAVKPEDPALLAALERALA